MQGITNARYERVYTRQRTRLREAANAVTRKRKRVHKRRLMRLHEAENACPPDSERDHTQTQTRSHANANAFTRGGQRVHRRRQTRSHEEANAFTRGTGGKRVCANEAANAFPRGSERDYTNAPYAYAYARMPFCFFGFFLCIKILFTVQYSTSELSATMGLKNNATALA